MYINSDASITLFTPCFTALPIVPATDERVQWSDSNSISTDPILMPFLSPRFWPTWLGLMALRLISLLPMAAQYTLGRFLGKMLYRLISKRRHIVEVNLKLCFPEKSEKERQQMAVEVFENNAIGMFETSMAWWSSPDRFEDKVIIEGLEYIEKAQQEGHGILLTGAHYSTLDLGGFLLGQKLNFSTVYRPHNNPLFDRFICQGRSRFVEQMLDNENSRAIVKQLRQGNVVWFAPDQDMGPKQSIFVRFFGIPAATVPATAKLARLGKAKVMIFGQHRLPNGEGYKLTISPALDPFPTSDEAADTNLVNQGLEQAIRQFPTQYMWVHRRFKTQPDAEKSHLYAKH